MSKKIVFTYPYDQCGLHVTYQCYRKAEGGTDLSGEWNFSHYSYHRDMVVYTKSHCELKRFEAKRLFDNNRLQGYYVALENAKNWLFRCHRLAYEEKFIVKCNNLGDEYRTCLCKQIQLNQNEPVTCRIVPFQGGGGYSAGGKGRPLPENMICDLKNTYQLINYDEDNYHFTLRDYWLCMTGEMRKMIEYETPKETDYLVLGKVEDDKNLVS